MTNKIKCNSYEILPSIKKNGKENIVGINIYREDGIVSINHHTQDVGESDKEKLKNPTDFKTISFPVEILMWLAPRLEGYRISMGIESGYDVINSSSKP